MKIVTGSIAASALLPVFRSTLLAALMAGAMGAAYAQQSGSSGVSGSNGLQPGAANTVGNSAANGGSLAPGASPGPVPGMGAAGIPGAASPAPALNNMRANGTSLYMSPDPRAPNVTGRPAPSR